MRGQATTPEGQHDAVTAARQELRVLSALARELGSSAERCSALLERAVEDPFNCPLQPVSTDLPPADPLLAEHRRGGMLKIDRDPELEAFVRARIDRMTLARVVDGIAAHFPPERRVSHSALHRWWHRHFAASRHGAAR